MPLAIFDKLQKRTPPGTDRKESVQQQTPSLPVDEARIAKFNHILRSYKNSRSEVEERFKANERFWQMRHWAAQPKEEGAQKIPATAHLQTCIQSKLADIMDSYPTANFRPRQRDDIEEAKRLSAVMPIVMAQNNFEKTYRNTSEYTLKNGVGVFHPYWDAGKLGNLGDISIDQEDALNVFWTPGITDIQKSAYVFRVELVDIDTLERMYPETKGKITKKAIELARFDTSEKVNTADKAYVVDCYYKTGKTLHLAKYVTNICLFSTENQPDQFPNGLYDHGRYLFVVVNFIHVENSLYGLGMVDVGADTQIQIDLMNEAIVENTLMGVRPRYFAKKSAGVNPEDIPDWTKTVVEVENLDDRNIKLIESQGLSGNYLAFIESKKEELKYFTANTDISSGAAPSGVTAASAIAALQEASGKHARLINKAFYNAYREIVWHVTELMRQFYSVSRWFRLAPDDAGVEQFMSYSNEGLKPQIQSDGTPRIPEFDIEITAEKANPYRKMENNELALSFYKMGFFQPQSADAVLACLEMMDFPQKDATMEKVRKNATLFEMMTSLAQIAMVMAQKSGDAQAMMTIQQILAQSGQASPSIGGVDPAKAANPGSITGESNQVEKARAQARAATEVS